MDDYKDTIKNNINYYLNLNGKIQNDLVNDLGLSSSVVSSWCRGYRTPSVPNLEILADYFNIKILDFFISDKNNINEILSIIQQLDDSYCEIVKEQAKTLLKIQNK